MKSFKIKINEVHQRELNIEAKNIDDAINEVEKFYENNEVLPENSTLVSFSIENKKDTNSTNVLIKEIISYLYEDEKRHYEEFEQEEKPNDHMFLKLEKLSKMIN